MRFLFGDYTLDPARRELSRGSAAIHVEPQVFDLLLHLVCNRERVVSRDDLLAAVWRGRIVSESTLNNRINAARHAIGDSGEQQRFIRTIARRGVRFVGEVRQDPIDLTRVETAAGSPAINEMIDERLARALVTPAPAGDEPGTDATRLLHEGRTAMGRHAWSEALASFSAADALGGLAPADLESLAEAAWWCGRVADSVTARERAFALYLEQQDHRRAAVLSMALAEHAFQKLSHSVAKGWMKRAEHLLENESQSIEHGYLMRFQARIAVDSDLDRAQEFAERAYALGTRFRDHDLEMLALHDRGGILVAKGQVADGLALMEEAMVAAVAGELSAMTTGRIYCNMVDICEKLADYRRAGEWDEAARRWCDRVGHASGFPGICRVKRAQLMRLRGTWADAEQEARRACAELEDFLSFAAAAFQEIGEVRLLVGDLSAAEQAFGRAQELGCDPQPGLARLRLVQGNSATARALIDRALADNAAGRLGRSALLPMQIEIALAQQDLDTARSAAEDLRAIAEAYGSEALMAAAAHAHGALHLAEGRPQEAATSLRQACRLWKESAVPYEEARSRLLLGMAYRAQGNDALGTLELETARAAFERLGAIRDRDRTADLLQRGR
jgi:DNA-binding winged helix-turn-helix (wHTH) protein/tetratricopeptide (TPR) repeat protein